MAKQCVVNRDKDGNIISVSVENPNLVQQDNAELIQRAIERNGGKSLDKAPNGEDYILYQSLSEGYDAFYVENRDPSMGKTWSVADSHQIREISETGSILFQNETQDENLEPVPQEILDEVIGTLMKKGLVNNVHINTVEELI